MADETLTWKFKGEDLFSGPVDRVTKALGGLDAQLAKTDRALGANAGRMRDASGRFLSVGERVAQSIGEGKAKLTGARADFAKAWSALMETGPAKRVASMLSPLAAGVGAYASKLGAPLGRALDAVMGSSLVTRARGLLTSVGGIVTGIGGKLAPVFGPLASGFKNIIGAAGDFGGALASKVMPLLKSLGAAGGGLKWLAAGAAATAGAAGLLMAAAGKWALSGLSFKEDTVTAFKTMLGTQKSAERVFAWANDFAATTPFQTEDVVQNVQRLLTGGFKENELDKLMKALGDVGANMGKEKMNQVGTGLVQIKAKGKLQGEEMMQLAEAGVGQSAVFDALSRNLGISVGAAKARVSGGQVTGEQGVAAVLEAIRTTQSGGTFGGAMEAKSKTLSGLMSSLEDIPKNLLFKADMGGVLEPIKKLMSGINDAFGKGKPLFNQGIAMFEHIGKAWGEAFGAIDGRQIESVLSGIMGAVEQFFTVAAPFAKGFFPELMKQVETLLTTMGFSGDAKSIEENGKAVAQALGIIANGVVLLAKALGIVAKVFGVVLDAMGLGPKLWGEMSDLAALMNGANATGNNAENQARAAQYTRELEAMRAAKGLPPSAMVAGFNPPTGAAGAAGASLNNVGNVAAINVIVSPDDAEAGTKIAKSAQGSLVDFLKGEALSWGG